MDNLEFRKFLTEHGITYEEYLNMTEEKQKEIEKRFKTQNTANNFKVAGQGIQGCGCILILLPILLILLYFIFSIITG